MILIFLYSYAQNKFSITLVLCLYIITQFNKYDNY